MILITLRVEGMDCGACERRLQTVLGRIDGVSAVDADHVRGEVRLRFAAARVDPETLAVTAAERIEQAGFTVTGHQRREGAGT